MSSIYLRNGIYQLQWYENGKLLRRSLKTDSLRVAKNAMYEFDDMERRRVGLAAVHEGVSTVGQFIEAYKGHAGEYYRKAGEPTSQAAVVKSVLDAMQPYHDLLTVQFRPMHLRALQEGWVSKGLARTTINRYAGIVRGMFKWGVSRELLPIEAYSRLVTVDPLKAGRTQAREPRR